MTQYFFTDAASASLSYAGEGTLMEDVSDADFDPSEAETITLDSPWNEFFGTDNDEHSSSTSLASENPNEEYVQFEATVAQPIVQPYFYDGELQYFRKDETELRRAQAQIDNLPWTTGHPENKRIEHADQIRGFWSNPRWEDGQKATLNIPANDPDAIRFAVTNDEVSVGFSGTLDWQDANDTKVDAIQRNMAYDHIASVESGRCPPEKGCGLHTDSADGHGHVLDAVRTKMTEEMETPQFSEGDWVKWDWSGGTAVGKVDTISTSESLSTSGTTRDPTEKGEPVYKIKHWDEKESEFGNMKVAYESNLRSANQPDGFADTLYAACNVDCTVGPCSCGGHDPFHDVDVSGEDIDLVPPEAAQDAAQDALDARGNDDVTVKGMTDHGWARAEQLASGEELSPSDIVGSSGAMAPWWSRHAQYSIEGGDTLSLSGTDAENPWADNSYTSGKGWGGVTGYKWAIRKGNEIKRARGEDPTYETVDGAYLYVDAPDGLYVEDGDWYGIAPDETADDEPKYELNNCNDVKDAYNLRNNGDYDIETSTLVDRIERAAQAHDCPPEQKPWADAAAKMASIIQQTTNS